MPNIAPHDWFLLAEGTVPAYLQFLGPHHRVIYRRESPLLGFEQTRVILHTVLHSSRANGGRVCIGSADGSGGQAVAQGAQSHEVFAHLLRRYVGIR